MSLLCIMLLALESALDRPGVGDHDWRAGNIGAATDFVCKLSCKTGLEEVASIANGHQLPPAGIFEPPFSINVNLTQVPIITKVPP